MEGSSLVATLEAVVRIHRLLESKLVVEPQTDLRAKQYCVLADIPVIRTEVPLIVANCTQELPEAYQTEYCEAPLTAAQLMVKAEVVILLACRVDGALQVVPLVPLR